MCLKHENKDVEGANKQTVMHVERKSAGEVQSEDMLQLLVPKGWAWLVDEPPVSANSLQDGKEGVAAAWLDGF